MAIPFTQQRYYDAIRGWMKRRFDWEIKEEWIVPCYGVVPSMNFAIEAYSSKGDGVVIQSPIYPPFASSVKRKKRKLYDNTLVYKNGHYEIDFEDFEKKIKNLRYFYSVLLITLQEEHGMKMNWTK